MPIPGSSDEKEVKALLKKLLEDKDLVCKFAIVASGPKDGELHLSKQQKYNKKEVQEAAEADAKKKSGGKPVKLDVMVGECQLLTEGSTVLKLVVAGKAAAKAVACFDHLLARGDYKTIGFTTVQLVEVDELADKVPAPPPPPVEKPSSSIPEPPPLPDSPGGKILIALGKLKPGLLAAIDAQPDQRGKLLGMADQIRRLASTDVAAAKVLLMELADLLKANVPATPKQQSSAEPTPPPPPPPPPSTPGSSKWTEEWSALEPKYLEALKTTSSDVAGKLRVVATYATEQAEAGQFDKGLNALARLRKMLDELPKSGGVGDEVAKGTVEKRKYLLDRMKQLPIEVRPEIDKLKQALKSEAPKEDADDLCRRIEVALQAFFDELQNEVDVAINKGDMRVLVGLKERVVSHELVSHLVSNPLTRGAAYRTLIVGALDEIEAKLAN